MLSWRQRRHVVSTLYWLKVAIVLLIIPSFVGIQYSMTCHDGTKQVSIACSDCVQLLITRVVFVRHRTDMQQKAWRTSMPADVLWSRARAARTQLELVLFHSPCCTASLAIEKPLVHSSEYCQLSLLYRSRSTFIYTNDLL